MSRKVYVVGVGMTKFEKPGSKEWDYPDMAREAGIKALYGEGRYSTSLNVFYTDFENAYFFFFDPTTSTQNLGGVPEVEYIGFELEGKAQFTDRFSAYYGLGYTDSDTTEAADPADEGNQAPLVTEYTVNLGGEYRYPLAMADDGTEAVFRVDYQRMGDTWWDPGNISVRSPINLLDMRVGVDVADNWSLMLWAIRG